MCSQPRQNRYARKNSQGGQSSIYSPAPEYDDPANCAEEDQYVTFCSSSSIGGRSQSEVDILFPGPLLLLLLLSRTFWVMKIITIDRRRNDLILFLIELSFFI